MGRVARGASKRSVRLARTLNPLERAPNLISSGCHDLPWVYERMRRTLNV